MNQLLVNWGRGCPHGMERGGGGRSPAGPASGPGTLILTAARPGGGSSSRGAALRGRAGPLRLGGPSGLIAA